MKELVKELSQTFKTQTESDVAFQQEMTKFYFDNFFFGEGVKEDVYRKIAKHFYEFGKKTK